MDVFSTSNPVFTSYAFCAAIIAFKMMLLSTITGMTRMKKGVFANPEDLKVSKGKGKLKFDDPDVERYRRAHLNDLENITPFFILGLLYVTTNPAPSIACLLFWIFTIARIAHTIVYAVYVVPQPARGVAFFTGWAINAFFALNIVLHYL